MSGYEYTPWIWPLLASAAFQVTLSLYLWRRRQTPGALPLSLVMLVFALWCVTDVGELTATEAASKEAWFLARDALVLPGVTVSLWFSLQYAGLERLLTRPVAAVLVGGAVATLPLYVVDSRLLWARLWWDGSVRGELGVAGAVAGVYGYAIALLATAVLVLLFIRSPGHRVSVALIVVGQVVVRVAYPLGVLNIGDVPTLESMALAVDFAALMYVVALFRFRLFELVPVARKTIIEHMPDAMLVLDEHDRIASLNRAAERLFGVPRSRAIGRQVAALGGASAALAELIAANGTDQGNVSIGHGEAQRWCHVSSTPLLDWRGRRIGRLVLLDDITEIKRAEEQLLLRQRALAAALERERMARELHDSVGQVFGYVGMQADAARKLIADGKPAEASRQLTRLAAVAREAHSDVRAYIEELHDVPSERLPFPLALRREVDAFASNYGIPIELTIHPALTEAVPDAAEDRQLLRIVQEALSNARRHASPRNVRVALDLEDATARLVIEDDGRGFDPAVVALDPDGRFGLRSMRERVAELQGELDIRSVPGEGTRLVVRVPMRWVPGTTQLAADGVAIEPAGASS